MARRPSLIGAYTSQILRMNEVVTCLYRELECHVTSWSKAIISWPRVQPIGHHGGSGLWVNPELVRAICTESAAAFCYLFGATEGVVWKWRKVFGVGSRSTTPGSKKEIQAAAVKGAAVLAKEWTDEERAAKPETAKHFKLRPGPRWTARNGKWTAKQLELLGTDVDQEIAAKLGRTPSAVRCQRTLRKIPNHAGSVCGGRAWTDAELKLLGTNRDDKIADEIGLTPKAVQWQRWFRKIPKHRNRRRQ